MREVTCPSCGARYPAGELRCPYCQSVNDLTDEKEFMEDLGELRQQMEELPGKEKARQTTAAIRDVGRSVHRGVLIFGAIVVAIGLLALGAGVIKRKNDREREARAREEYLWKQENEPRLNACYEAGDYEGLLELYEELEEGPIYSWEHFEMLWMLVRISRIPEEMEQADREAVDFGTDSKVYQETMTILLYDELEIYYFDLRCKNERDREIVREQGAFCLSDLETRFALTDEQWEKIDKSVQEGGGLVSIRLCEEIVKAGK